MRIQGKIGAAALLLLIIAVPAALAATSCADGCSCMVPEDAKNKGYSYCLGKETPCGTDNLGRMLYCFSMAPMTPSVTTAVPSQTPVAGSCGQGCDCMAESDAKAKFGGLYQRCSDAVCGYVQSATTTGGSNAAAPKYCFRKLEQPTTVPATPSTVCPAGCSCLNEADAKAKFNGAYERCSNAACGYDQTQAAVSARYCFRAGQSPATPGGTVPPVQQVCPDGCGCMSDEEGQKMGYSYCSGVPKICGYQSWTGSTASTSGQRPLYCYGKGTLPACSGDCECMSEAAAVQKFGTYQFCSNAICGYEQSAAAGTISTTMNVPVATAVIPRYCLRKAEVPVQVTGCSYSKEKQGCTGTCMGNAGCVVVGTEKNTATGEETPVCKCQAGSCYFDYSLDTCVGSCPSTGQNCQVNTMSKDPLTGKTLFAECHCKAGEAGPAVTSPVTSRTIVPDLSAATTMTYTQPCGSDAATGGCSGACPADQPCGSYDCTIDSTGRKVCTNCRCLGCEFDQASGSCRGYCAKEGTTCECTGYTTDSSGKLVCSSGCSCRTTCRQDAAGGCSGECPGGGTCTVTGYITGKAGAPSPVCGCGAAGTTAPAAKSANQGGEVIRSIGDFFRNLFGWK